MKTLLLTIFIITIPFAFIHGQSVHQKEIGIRTGNFESFDLLYKNKINENTYRRLRLGDANIRYSKISSDGLFSIGGTIAGGLEKRKQLTNAFNFIYGFDGLFGATYNRKSGDGYGNYSVGMGMVIGWNYILSKHITLGVETIPSLTYSSDFGQGTRSYSINAGFSTSMVNLTATYGFQK